MKHDHDTPGGLISRRSFAKRAGAIVAAIVAAIVGAMTRARSLARAAVILAPKSEQVPVAGESKIPSTVSAMVQFEPGGRVKVTTASPQLGRGASLVMAKTAAATLNLRVELIDVKLSDPALETGPFSAGSKNAAAIGAAVQAAAMRARSRLLSAAVEDKGSPLCGDQPEELDFVNGRIIRKGQPESGESFNAFLARNGNRPVASMATTKRVQGGEEYPARS